MKISGDKPPGNVSIRPAAVSIKVDTSFSDYISYLTSEIKAQRPSKLISDAIELATRAHKGQVRKGTSLPYIVHPLRVANTLIRYNCSDEVVAAGILHDTTEDTKVTYEDIKLGFGVVVADLVKGASEPNKSDSWENRKRHTIEYLKTAPKDVLFIVCADKLDNIYSIWDALVHIGEDTWAKFSRGREHQKWYYESLVEVFMNRIDDQASSYLFHELKTGVDYVFN